MAVPGSRPVGATLPDAGRPAEGRSPVRVLFVIGTLNLGGAERQLVELACQLDARFAPMVCCLSSSGPLEAELVRAGVPVTTIGMRGIRTARGWDRVRAAGRIPLDLVRFLQVVRQARAGIVHAFLFHAYVLAPLAGRLSRVPVIIASRRSLSHFKQGRRSYRLAETVANRLTDLVIANSEAVRQDALTTEGLDAHHVTVIYNGVDIDRYRAATGLATAKALGLGPGPVVLVVANLIPYKGHDHFLRAWQTVCLTLPDATALLAGDGPARAACERLAAELGIAERVRFLGQRRDIPELLAVCDVLVHPSLEEGFCNALLEAMAAGRPVVTTTAGGNPEAVVDGETGVLVPPADAEALSTAMLDVLGRPDRGRALGEAGRRRATSQFSTATMVERYQQTYCALAARAGAR